MNSTTTLKSIIIALLILLGLSLYINTIEVQEADEVFCTDFSQEPHSTLETGLVGDMVSVYRNNQLSAINNEMRVKTSNDSYEGSESILFDLEIVSKFIYHIKQGVYENAEKTYKKGEKIEDEKIGIRIYYAAYPEKAKWGNIGYRDLNDFSTIVDPGKYEKNLTLVMIPTRVNSNGEIVDFDPFDETTYETGLPKYKRIACEVEEINGKRIYIETENCFKPAAIDTSPEATTRRLSLSGSNTENGNTFSRNHGQMYPPYTSSGIAF